jgi:1,4-alpha-glucan branching enzyme
MSEPMHFVLALHSHLPYVLNHGRWPHGSDWICEAALDTYLPLIEVLRGLEHDRVRAPLTIGVTPVLANQLGHPTFVLEMERFFEQRLQATVEAPASLAATGDSALLPLVDYWRERLERMRALFHAIDRDLIGALRALEAAGRIEIIGSAATHGFLPLLARDESIRLQLALGFREHRRIFGRDPVGCWLPECAYRPRGPWAPWPGGPSSPLRRGIEEHLADAGFRYTFVDAHLASGGRPLNISSEGSPLPPSQLDDDDEVGRAGHSPYRAYRVTRPYSPGDVSVYVRDPRASSQVWSRHEGYPGDRWYLEFHKMRWPGGLKLWRVSEPGLDLGAKGVYEPAEAQQRVQEHALHFAGILAGLAAREGRHRGAVVAAPFDTELFGHWWFEGPDFLGQTFRALGAQSAVVPVTGAEHLRMYPPHTAIKMPPGTWGANGDFSMWIGDRTVWTWQRLWPLENAFWEVAPAALANPAARPVLAQAAREMLLAQSSDWQFIISTGAVVDYAERRFREHCADAERLVAALAPGNAAGLESAQRLAAELQRRDDVFPDILPALSAALAGSRATAAV